MSGEWDFITLLINIKKICANLPKSVDYIEFSAVGNGLIMSVKKIDGFKKIFQSALHHKYSNKSLYFSRIKTPNE